MVALRASPDGRPPPEIISARSATCWRLLYSPVCARPGCRRNERIDRRISQNEATEGQGSRDDQSLVCSLTTMSSAGIPSTAAIAQRRSCGSPAPAKRLAERLQDGDVRRGSTSVHYLSDIAVDLVYVDDADTGLC